ncbi:MerR family transcriptional regulator [Streptomyces sp. GS7]|nr:MerR family transcriptional regulator [Streptomyces sp. GS7]
MRIGELAERAGMSTRALRYYESLGLLSARRTGNGYRDYGEDDLAQLRQIRTLQEFGFTLEQTRPFVDCLRAGHPEGDSCPASLEVYRSKLAELDEVIDRLREIREQVGAQLARAEVAASAATPAGPPPRCELTAGQPPARERDREEREKRHGRHHRSSTGTDDGDGRDVRAGGVGVRSPRPGRVRC